MEKDTIRGGDFLKSLQASKSLEKIGLRIISDRRRCIVFPEKETVKLGGGEGKRGWGKREEQRSTCSEGFRLQCSSAFAHVGTRSGGRIKLLPLTAALSITEKWVASDKTLEGGPDVNSKT